MKANQLTINVRGKLLSLENPLIMGILNLTSDSFYAQSRTLEEEKLQTQALKMISQGADILDLGACSTRPGAIPVEETIEKERIEWALSVIKPLIQEKETIISIDTFRATVAEAGVAAGAHIINDVSGGKLDAQMFATVAKLQVPYVLTHSRGNSQTMNSLAIYKKPVEVEVLAELLPALTELRALGLKDIIIDPGIGFAKNAQQNFQLLQALPHLELLEYPLLIGVSRKRFIWQTLGTNAEEALNGTSIMNFYALQQGANILRVHDVKEAKEATLLWQQLRLNGKEIPE